ncbi:PfkB family carbohydrate kinase [Paracoccus albus]|uniref:PfkB family carbohydrate kinase n=1 Tax=Paracoccus albus TaxID=3017784 RepID=UPI0022F0B60C|nr:PfkB family carbohydrate kinase [Paracoccus albus]WBU62120.1 PfkB family carbohydrate kinase [Paracoccus albus]
MPKLIQLTAPVLDLVYKVTAIPESGTEAIVNDFSSTPGGGINAMVAARSAGMDVALGGSLGSGPFADTIREMLAEHQIEHIGAAVAASDQGSCVVLLEPDGERTFVAYPGAEGHISPSDLTGLAVHGGDWVMLSGYTLYYPGAGPAVAEWIAQLPDDIHVLFDPSPLAAEIPAALLEAVVSRVDWISSNRAEAAVLVGDNDPVGMAGTMANGRKGAVLRQGADGALLAMDGRVEKIPPHPVHVVDSNGAGDCHIGSFIAEISRSGDAARAVRYANVAAALSTTRDGPATPPERGDVLALI